MEESKLNLLFKIFLYIINIVVILFFGFVFFELIYTKVIDYQNADNANSISGYGIIYLAMLLYSLVVNGITLVISFILFIFCLCKKNKYKKKYIITTLLPIISEILIIVVGYIISLL